MERECDHVCFECESRSSCPIGRADMLYQFQLGQFLRLSKFASALGKRAEQARKYLGFSRVDRTKWVEDE